MTIDTFFHILLHTLGDFIKLLPFLFLSYLLMEWMEHRMGDKTRAVIGSAGKFGPLLGGALGAVPQCGFSGAAAGLYAGRVISLGTLFAVFLSTSDEMLPVAVSHLADGSVTVWFILRILGVKALIGILVGFLIDLLFRQKHTHTHEIGQFCNDHACGCEGGILSSSVKHTVEVGLFILAVSFALDLVVHTVGEEALVAFLSSRGILTCLLTPLVGLIPNCASSVVITELFISGALTVGAFYGGLLTGAGVGVLILFRTNKNWRENLLITLSLYGIGVVFGLIIDGLHLLFG